MAQISYYPPLSKLLSLDQLPIELGFLDQGLESLGGLYFRDLEVETDAAGAGAAYALELVAYRRITLPIMGLPLNLVFEGGDNDNGDLTAIPVRVQYQWPILRYLQGFDPGTFSPTPENIFALLEQILDVSEPELLQRAVAALDGINDLAALVNRLQTVFGIPLTPPQGDSPLDLQHAVDELRDVTGMSVLSVLVSLTAAGNNGVERLLELAARLLTMPVEDFISALTIPRIAAEMELALGVEFDPQILRPLDPELEVSRLDFGHGVLFFDSQGSIGHRGNLSVDMTASEIVGTGLTLSFTNARLDLSRHNNSIQIPGLPADFIGLVVEEAELGLPAFWSRQEDDRVRIVGRDLIIGTGGISGVFAIESEGQALMQTQLGGYGLALTAFDLTFRQSAVTDSRISGNLTLPGLADGPSVTVPVTIQIGGGVFTVSAQLDDNPPLLVMPDVFQFAVTAVALTVAGDGIQLELAGDLEIIAAGPDGEPMLPGVFPIQKLLLHSDGSFEFEGGLSLLDLSISMAVGPVSFSVTALHFGSLQQEYQSVMRRYAYFGFDGGLSMDPVGVDARGDGIKFFFTTDHGNGLNFHSFIRIEGIGIDLIIPGDMTEESAAVLLSGYLSVKQPEPPAATGTQYTGAVSVSLPKLGIAGSAAMQLNPDTPAWYLDLGLELPTPILLGATGLGIYGFRGLVSDGFLPDREDGQDWWEFYKRPQTGIGFDKFVEDNGFSAGTGASLATAFDSGYAFSSKLFFLLGLPDVFIFQGQAALLKRRVGLDTRSDPPFFAAVFLTPSDVSAGFGVDYRIPAGGEILDLDGLLEMSFSFRDASAWYLNVGRDLPENKRVRAKFLTLFDGWSYLMTSRAGIRAGAGCGWDINKKAGPVSIALNLYQSVDGSISFKPVQMGGTISAGGGAALKIWGFGFGFSIRATLAAEAPKPFVITGRLGFELDLPWPLEMPRVDLELTWSFDDNLNTDEVAVLSSGQDSGLGPAAAVNMLTGESFPLLQLQDAPGLPAPEGRHEAMRIPPPLQDWPASFDSAVIPLDCRIDIEFDKPVLPGGFRMQSEVTDAHHTDMIPPRAVRSPQIRHSYKVLAVDIFYWDQDSWQPFDPITANMPHQDIDLISPELRRDTPFGTWQVGETPNRVTRLSLMTIDPFDYLTRSSGSDAVPEQFGYGPSLLFCAGEQVNETCQDWEKPFHTTLIPVSDWLQDRHLLIRADYPFPLILQTPNPFGLHFGLRIGEDANLLLQFKQSMSRVSLRLTSRAAGVTLIAQRREVLEPARQGRLARFGFVSVMEKHLSDADMQEPVVLESADTAFDRLWIKTSGCNTWEQAEAQYREPALAWAKAETIRLFDSIKKLERQLEKAQSGAAKASEKSSCKSVSEHSAASLPSDRLLELAAQRRRLAEVTRLADHLKGMSDPLQELPFNPYSCATFLHSVCFLSHEDYQTNLLIPNQQEVTRQNETMINSMKRIIQPIWRPNTCYALHIRTRDTVDINGELPEDDAGDANGELPENYDRSRFFGFRTAGGLGHFHRFRPMQDQLPQDSLIAHPSFARLAEDETDQFKLRGLLHYLDQERCFPNPAGKLVYAKPLYFNEPKLFLAWRAPYVFAMFNNWEQLSNLPALESSLRVTIQDPAGDHLAATPEWRSGSAPQQPESIRLINNLILNGLNCSGMIGGIRRPEMRTQTNLPRLQGSKLYTAVFTAIFEGDETEVHRYNFQTSRYGDFSEHLASNRLGEDDSGLEVRADFEIALSLHNEIFQIFAAELNRRAHAAAENLRFVFPNRFERILQGVFELEPLPEAACVEFNLIRDQESDRVAAVLIRSPEPFNDPRLSDAVLEQRGLSLNLVTLMNDPPPEAFRVVYSGDRAGILISLEDGVLPAGKLEITFNHLAFDGEAVVVQDTVVKLFDLKEARK